MIPVSITKMYWILSIVLSCFVIFRIETSVSASDMGEIKRRRRRLGMYGCAVIIWPLVIMMTVGLSALCMPVTAIVSVLVAVYLSFELSVTSCYNGAFAEYDNSDSVYERSVQVSTVAFAVATLLLSQKRVDLADLVATPVFAALLFCTGAAVPSAASRRRVGASGYWAALQKVAVSFAAGLLCVALARCMDELSLNVELRKRL